VIDCSLVDTRYGKMWVFDEDNGCSFMLKEYGEYSPLELAFIEAALPPDGTFIDLGAHIGAMTIPIAQVCKKVYAIEPQEEVREVLLDNLDIAGVTNVEVIPYAIGSAHEQRFYNLEPSRRGSTEMGPDGQVEVQVVPLDELDLAPDFIKIDVEGMEIDVLLGAQKTLSKYRPTLLLERQPANTKTLRQCLTLLGYTIYTVDLPMFVPNNYNKNPKNHFIHKGHMMLGAVPYPELPIYELILETKEDATRQLTWR